MTPAMFCMHLDYMFDMDKQVLALVQQLSDEQFNAPNDYSLGSVHEQIVHIVAVQDIWLERIQGRAGRFQYAADMPTVEHIAQFQAQTEARWRAYANDLTDEELLRPAAITNSRGELHHQPVWQILLHLVNHSTDHRAQLLAAMHQVGSPTMPQDWIFYARGLPNP